MLFEDCVMGKTAQQLEWARQVSAHEQRPVLILAPLAVSEQTRGEGEKFGIPVTVCRTQREVREGVHITNYEMLEHFDPSCFCGVVLDESSILKHHAGKTRQRITDAFRYTKYKLACTATPAPNDYMELCNHAEFLDVMRRPEALSTFFVHDGGDTSKWRLKGHAAEAFWQWMSAWAMTVTRPSDIGYPDEGFSLPEMRLHEIVTASKAGEAADGQQMLLPDIAKTLNERRRARRDSLTDRCEAAAAIANGDGQCLVWCDLNDESETLAGLIDGAVEVRGSHAHDLKAEAMTAFAKGGIRCLVTKPSIAGFGMNWQNCRRMVFVGLSDSYEMFYQAIRRCWRFGQQQDVEVYVITSESEGAVKGNIERKDRSARRMMRAMTKYARASLQCALGEKTGGPDGYDPCMEMGLPAWLGVAN